jgi:hypothetical protein
VARAGVVSQKAGAACLDGRLIKSGGLCKLAMIAFQGRQVASLINESGLCLIFNEQLSCGSTMAHGLMGWLANYTASICDITARIGTPTFLIHDGK